MSSFRASAAQQTPSDGGLAPTPNRSRTPAEGILAAREEVTNPGPHPAERIVIYHEAIVKGSWLYTAVILFLAATVEAIALGFGHYKNSQPQSRHAFLFSGFRAVALAFLLLLAVLFLLRITELFSRVTFVFQFIVVEFAVLAARAFSYSRLQFSIARGLGNAGRVVLFGDAMDRAKYSVQLKWGSKLSVHFRFGLGPTRMAI
jgi:uncharacterized membrane protein